MTTKGTTKKTRYQKKNKSCKQASERSDTVILSSESNPGIVSSLEQLITAAAQGDKDQMHAALQTIRRAPKQATLTVNSIGFLNLFHQSVWALRKDFEHSEKSASEITLPDVSDSLERLRVRAEEATKRTLSLINQQEQLVAHSERLVTDLEAILKNESFDRQALERELLEWRVITAAMRRLSVEMLCTQDFEDLCGFILPKVQEFIKSLEGDIRGVFAQLNVDLPVPTQCALPTQSDIDDLLKQHNR